MALKFPNHSRSYDPEHRRIRFWGHDNTVEVAFFVEEDAILKLRPDTPLAEAGFLAAFDALRSRIFEVATALYGAARGRNHTTLSAADF